MARSVINARLSSFIFATLNTGLQLMCLHDHSWWLKIKKKWISYKWKSFWFEGLCRVISFWYPYTLILRGPSRRARLLLGVSMVITLSRPLSREPNIFPPRFFFPLSPVTAMSRDLDLEGKHDLTYKHWTSSFVSIYLFQLLSCLTTSETFPVVHSPSLWTEG